MFYLRWTVKGTHTKPLARINPMTQPMAVIVRLSLLMARDHEKSWDEGFE